MNSDQQYVSKIHIALYPRWAYTGGSISATVKGREVTLQGYQEPNDEEWNLIVNKVHTALGFEPKIKFCKLGENPSNLGEKVDKAPTPNQSAAESIMGGKVDKASTPNQSAVESIMGGKVDKASTPNQSAAESIMGLLNFVIDAKKAIDKKSAKDIEILKSFLKDCQITIEKGTQTVGGGVGDTTKKVSHLLNEATKGVGKIPASLRNTIMTLWDTTWRDRLFYNLTQGVDLDKAKDTVKKLKAVYPSEKPSQIANRLIQEKAIFSTAVAALGVGATIISGGLAAPATALVDFYNSSLLLVELCYQISVVYGFDDIDDPARQTELLGIFSLALSGTEATQLGLGFLFKHTPIANWTISASTNVFVFNLVGYTACQFYEAKLKGMASPITSEEDYSSLLEKVKICSKDSLSQKTVFDKIVAQTAVILPSLSEA